MRITLLDGTNYYLPDDLYVDTKIELVNKIINQFEDDIHKNWMSNRVKVFLDVLSTYLCKGEKHKHDKEVLSGHKMRQMRNKNKQYMVFSDLSKEQRARIGIIDYNDEEYE